MAATKPLPLVAVCVDVRGFTAFYHNNPDQGPHLAGIIYKTIRGVLSSNSPCTEPLFKSTGDGILAVFPTLPDQSNPQEASAKYASFAYGTAKKLIKEYRKVVQRDAALAPNAPMDIGIGIASGFGFRVDLEDGRPDYFGRCINLSARLADLARPSGLVLSEAAEKAIKMHRRALGIGFDRLIDFRPRMKGIHIEESKIFISPGMIDKCAAAMAAREKPNLRPHKLHVAVQDFAAGGGCRRLVGCLGLIVSDNSEIEEVWTRSLSRIFPRSGKPASGLREALERRWGVEANLVRSELGKVFHLTDPMLVATWRSPQTFDPHVAKCYRRLLQFCAWAMLTVEGRSTVLLADSALPWKQPIDEASRQVMLFGTRHLGADKYQGTMDAPLPIVARSTKFFGHEIAQLLSAPILGKQANKKLTDLEEWLLRAANPWLQRSHLFIRGID